MTVAVIDARGGSGPQGAGKPPRAYSPPVPPQALGAECNIWDDDCAHYGFDGGPGADGVGGPDGGAGGNGGSISFEIGVLNGAVKFTAAGGVGGHGGAGGAPGLAGLTSGEFSASSDCPFPGIVGTWGRPGAPGATGAHGAGGNGGSVRLEVTG